ncbi:MAG TPA: WD40 repeat domain-containing protein, partial [Streptosporangiaceae bacterium]|nr:WD40 repeat domain-containing protein [Streptosporangiaceae bacterium]
NRTGPARRAARSGAEDAAAAWDRNGAEPSALYRGSRLDAARAWADDHAPDLTATARLFLAASCRLHRRARLLRPGVAVLAALTMVASITSVVAVQQRATIIRVRDQITAEGLVGDARRMNATDPSLAAQLSLAAYTLQSGPEDAALLLSTQNASLSVPLPGYANTVQEVAFSPDGRTLATADGVGPVRLWNVTDPGRPRPLVTLPSGSDDTSDGVAFSPRGLILASADDGSIRLWDVADPAQPALLSSFRGDDVASVAFSRDGQTMAAMSQDGMVRLWGVTNPAQPRLLGSVPGPGADAMAFSPHGPTLATVGQDGTVRLWNVTHPSQPRLLRAVSGLRADAVAFSPHGAALATFGLDGMVRLWDGTDPAQPRLLGSAWASAPAGAARFGTPGALAFSPNGQGLALSGLDGTVRLWDVGDPALPVPVGSPLPDGDPLHRYGDSGGPGTVAFSPDGQTLASTDAGPAGVLLWNIPQTVLPGGPGGFGATAFSPDSKILASSDQEGNIQLWDVRDPAHPQALGPPLASSTGIVNALAFSPGGRTLASGGRRGTIQLWNVTSPSHPRALGPPVTGAAGPVFSLMFRPRGHVLASSGQDGTVRLWDATDPARLTPLGPPLIRNTGPAYAVAFSPNGRVLAAAGVQDRAIQLWNVTDPARPRRLGRSLTGRALGLDTVAFSPDSRTLVSSNSNGNVPGESFGPVGTIQLWDVTRPGRPRLLGQQLTDANNVGLGSVTFSSDGRTLAISGTGSTIGRWGVTDPPAPGSSARS